MTEVARRQAVMKLGCFINGNARDAEERTEMHDALTVLEDKAIINSNDGGD